MKQSTRFRNTSTRFSLLTQSALAKIQTLGTEWAGSRDQHQLTVSFTATVGAGVNPGFAVPVMVKV